MISPREGLGSPSPPSRGKDSQIAQAATEAQGRFARSSEARHALLALLVGVASWELVGRVLRYGFLPPASNVLRAALEMIASGQILGNLAASFVGLITGYGLAVSSGVLLGLLMGRYRWVELILEVYISAFLAAPKIVFVPILYALFGMGRGTQVAVVYLSAFFIIVINTMSGIRNVDASCIEMARAFGASERQLFWKVLFPGALPLTMAGLRLGVGRAVRGMIRGEMFISLFGLGALLRKYGSRFNSEKVFAILLLVISVALICSYVMQFVERRVIGWTEAGS